MQRKREPGSAAKVTKQIESCVAILDAGAQYGKVIDRRVRNLAVRSDLLPLDTPLEDLESYSAFIISGGPDSVYAPGAPKPDPRIWKSNKPILGICYGMQLMNQAFGGTVEHKDSREDGPFVIKVKPTSSLFKGLQSKQKVLMSHGDSLAAVARGFHATAMSGTLVAAIANEKKRMYGVQFHPEVDLTDNGQQMLANFLFDVAALAPNFTVEDRLHTAIEYIRKTVGNRHVLTFASGGVDSTVCAAMVGLALPAEQIHVVHIDTGFMRHKESQAVKQALGIVGIELEVVDAADQFFNATTTIKGKKTRPLYQVTDPESKRSIIGDTFMHVMERVVAKLGLDAQNTVLAQGTLRPDLIESASPMASSKAAVIKTHHNDTQLVRDLRRTGRVIEPLKELHKDEVRQLGESLGLPVELVWRQPFPGPGLAIRLLCAEQAYVNERFTDVLAALQKFNDHDTTAHLLPVRTVGVQGDGRSYNYLVGLSGNADWPKLFKKALKIPREIHDVNRVVYIFGDKLELSSFDITPTFPTREAIDQLRQADWQVSEVLRKYGLHKSLSQVPIVSFPVHFGLPGNHSIGIRPFITNDFMTGTPAIPGVHLSFVALNEMVERVLSIPKISRVVYDLTTKPPGTTEWE